MWEFLMLNFHLEQLDENMEELKENEKNLESWVCPRSTPRRSIVIKQCIDHVTERYFES